MSLSSIRECQQKTRQGQSGRSLPRKIDTSSRKAEKDSRGTRRCAYWCGHRGVKVRVPAPIISVEMSKPKVSMQGWGLENIPDQPTSMRSPQERNLLQFSPFAGMGEGPPPSMGRFRRVMTTVSGSNGPSGLANIANGLLSQLSSGNSGDENTPSAADEKNEFLLATSQTPKLERQDATDEPESAKEDGATVQSSGNGGYSNSLTISLDQAELQGKQSLLQRVRQKEASYGDTVSDMEPSHITAHSKNDSSEHNSSTQHMSSGANADGNESGNVGFRGVTAALTKKLSQDGRMIRKISGLLSRSKQGTKIDSTTEGKNNSERGGSADQRTEPGVPVRKGSLLGMLGRKERLPMRKRSFMKGPRIKASRNKSGDEELRTEEKIDETLTGELKKLDDGSPSEKEIKITAALGGFQKDGEGEVGDDGEASLSEDDLAKRAVQIEKFLNSVAFL